MRKTLFLFIAAFLYSVAAVCQFPERIIKVMPQEALDVAVKACSDNKSQYDYFISETSVKKDNSLFHAVFVDKKPGAGWEHPCAYVYVRTTRSTSEATPYHIVEEATHPKGTIKMRPIRVHDRYGSNSKFKPRVAKLNANAGEKNSFSGNTYAVILSGGLNMESNEERYWNDCSFIYQTLRNRYDVPKNNIKVIMSDGTDPSEDMKSNNGEYVSSPLDLDYDGIADIEYAATKENVKNVLKSLCAKLTDKDHLLLYVIDHGGYDTQAKQSYICLWNEEKLYPGELNEWLSTGDAGYINILMGQCHSGGFVKALKGNNRIVATACSEDELSYGCEELPFDEFVYHWTSALNGFDAEGNQVTAQTDTLPTGALKPVTMIKAFEYANEHDMYTDGKFPYAEETPCLSYLKNSTAEDLALDTIPPTVYLYITDGSVEKPYEAVIISYNPLKYSKFKWLNRWNSSDVWLRNQADGFENQKHENPKISENKRDIYVYTKVKNRGVKPCQSKSWSLATWWAESSLVITKEVWEGGYVNSKNLLAGPICDGWIEEQINPGDSLIIEHQYLFSKKNIAKMVTKGKCICLLANVYKDTDPSDFDKSDDEYVLSVWDTDRFAQCNRTYLYPTETEEIGKVTLFNGFRNGKDFVLVLKSDEDTVASETKLRTKMCVGPEFMKTWKESGASGMNVKADVNKDGYMDMNSDMSVVSNLSMSAKQREEITFKFNPIVSQAITKETQKQIDVAVYDSETGKCLGGESFIINLKPRPAITPVIEKTLNADGTYTLVATNIDEDVTYEWHDSEGKIIGTGNSITIPANSANVDYSLEVASVADDAINTATMTVERMPMIKEVKDDGRSIDVSFNTPVRKNTSMRVLSSTGSSVVSECKLVPGTMDCTMPVANVTSGVYQITLVENGVETESMKYMK